MGKRKGAQSYKFFPKVPDYCRTCPEVKKTPCENQILLPSSLKREVPHSYWCQISPQPCPKVNRYAWQDYVSQREMTHGTKPAQGNLNPQIDNISLNISEREIWKKWAGSLHPQTYVKLKKERIPFPRGQTEPLDYPFLTKLQNDIIFHFYFLGRPINEIAHRLSSPGKKTTIQVIRNEKRKALRKIEKYAKKYGHDFISKLVDERAGREDLKLKADYLRARALLNKNKPLSRSEREWFRSFVNTLDTTTWREQLWKK